MASLPPAVSGGAAHGADAAAPLTSPELRHDRPPASRMPARRRTAWRNAWKEVPMKVLTILAAVLAWAALGGAAPAQTSKVRLAVGGKPSLFYLPLTVAERLGYFKDEGLDVEISDFPGGARALQALIRGSDVEVTGAFDHTIQMQAKNQQIVAIVHFGQFPGTVLSVLT